MRTLLRNIPTGLYVQSLDAWTSNPNEALDFRSMSQAIKFAEQSGYRKMELALVSDQHCTAVPLETVGCGVWATHSYAQAAEEPWRARA